MDGQTDRWRDGQEDLENQNNEWKYKQIDRGQTDWQTDIEVYFFV